jgi:hypothetical protein
MLKRTALALTIAAGLALTPSAAHADTTPDFPVIDQPAGSHTSTACLYERYYDARLCGDMGGWIISKAQEDADYCGKLTPSKKHPGHCVRKFKPAKRWTGARGRR